MKAVTHLILTTIAVLWLTTATLAQARPRAIDLTFIPTKTTINFTLGDVLHAVHGSFYVKRGAVHFDPATNKISGEIVVDAASGHSGNNGRDKRMQSEVLESSRYPDIAFRPDHVEGQVSDVGLSAIQVHGMFSIHGAEHEMTIPVRVEMTPGQWTATLRFVVPFVEWGMKNPSAFLLRVNQSVDIEIQALGEIP